MEDEGSDKDGAEALEIGAKAPACQEAQKEGEEGSSRKDHGPELGRTLVALPHHVSKLKPIKTVRERDLLVSTSEGETKTKAHAPSFQSKREGGREGGRD